MISEKLVKAVASVRAAREAFIKPKPVPCNHIDCLTYNEHGQCPDCGWLKPLKGDTDNGWTLPMREVPLGPPNLGMLGLTAAEVEYVKRELEHQ